MSKEDIKDLFRNFTGYELVKNPMRKNQLEHTHGEIKVYFVFMANGSLSLKLKNIDGFTIGCWYEVKISQIKLILNGLHI